MNNIGKSSQHRRAFLQNCAGISLLGSGAGAMNGKLSLIGSALAASTDYSALKDYKALVCVFLYGGSDSFSMFVPTEQDAYNRYAASRGHLAINHKDLLLSQGSEIGFHPLLPDLHSMYESGNLAVIGNVGNLIGPVTKLDINNASPLVPNDLFAHNHQQEQWLKALSSSPASVVSAGWGGRMADLLQDANNTTLPPSFSLAGSNHWLPGKQVQPLGLNAITGLSLLNYFDSPSNSGNNKREASLHRILKQYEQNTVSLNPLKVQAAASLTRAKSSSDQLAATLAAHTNANFKTGYDTSSRLAQQLRMVARLIAGNQSLGMKRQIFFVAAGGWDTHDHQTPRLSALLKDLNRSLKDFQGSLTEIGLNEAVTTFTASDFGRTLTINGDGSDHGWGGHYAVMGGAVNGGNLFGTLPSFEISGEDDTGDKGRVIPSLSINQYGAALASWMGVASSDLTDIFPDLANFDNNWLSDRPLFS